MSIGASSPPSSGSSCGVGTKVNIRLLLAGFLVLTLLTSAIVPAPPVLADNPSGKVPKGQIEKLEHGWRRLDANIKTHKIGEETHKGKKYELFEAEISTLPTTLDDNETLIDTSWYHQTDPSGQGYYESGVNLFSVRVSGGRVSLKDRNGRLSVYNPVLALGGETFGGGTASIVSDPLNEYYADNCLLWDYGTYSTGWGIFSKANKLERYLRVIEGYITEMWVLPADPQTDVRINLHETAESNFGGHTDWLKVYDASGALLAVTQEKSGTYVISATEFRGRNYPVTIDPTSVFYSSSYDDGVMGTGANYPAARDAATGTVQGTNTAQVGQVYVSAISFYTVSRLMLMFNSAALPDDAVIIQARINVYGHDGGSGLPDNDFYLVAQSGMPTYPHMPVVSADYDEAHYTGDGGFLHTSDWSLSSYNVVLLNGTGIGWVSKTGWTKFALRSSDDIADTSPGANEYNIVNVKTYEYGMTYAPALSVYYSLPVATPTITTMAAGGITGTQATLGGYLNDDGGESCSLRFQYGTDTSYGSDTSWSSNYNTGDTHGKVIYGLSPGTTYHCRAQGMNSAGTSSGSDVTFTTPPGAPYSFSATAGNNTVALAWTKGTGADKTMVRRRTDTYPTSPVDGTQIYFDTGSNKADNTAVNGTDYYYSIWAEETGVYSTSYVSDDASPSGPSVGAVTTNAATAVGVATATLNLDVTDLGGTVPANVDVRFQYYWAAGAWADNETAWQTGVGLGPCSEGIAGLPGATLIHARAVVLNDTGTAFGSDAPFTTGANSAPTMTTDAATGVQLSAATLNGTVTADGGLASTVWFEWGLTDSYGTTTATISGLITADTFYAGLVDLEPSTTYHFRAVGENAEGIGYGADDTFLTSTPTTPTCRTDAASEVGANSATLNATVLTDGDVECDVQFQYSTTGAYGGEEIDTGWVSGYTKDQTFNQLISGLDIDTLYHCRAQTRNGGGTGSGDDEVFTTVFTAPEDFRAKAISSTTVNLDWVMSGDLTHIRYKTGGYPIDRADGALVFSGVGEITSISGLLAGTTYYFRAWSWREGDVWADGYSEDVATTQAAVMPAEEEAPDFVGAVEEPDTWFQTPEGAALENTPFYQFLVDFADSFEMPESTMFGLITLVLTIIAAIVVFVAGGGVLLGVVVGGAVMALCSGIGMAPLWFLAIYILLGGGMIFVVRRT